MICKLYSLQFIISRVINSIVPGPGTSGDTTLHCPWPELIQDTTVVRYREEPIQLRGFDYYKMVSAFQLIAVIVYAVGVAM